MDNRKIGILGTGVVGASWAVLFAANSRNRVVLYDTEYERVVKSIKNVLPAHARVLLSHATPPFEEDQLEKEISQLLSRISGVQTLEEMMEGVDYVQECVFESLEVKKSVFEQMGRLVSSPNTILASSTSCLVPSKFTGEMEHREQSLVVHPLNPPLLLSVVEVIPSPWTRPDILQNVRSFLQECKMSPVVLKKEVDGFAFNRLQYALMAEAWALVEEGVMDPLDVNCCVRDGLARRWSVLGPFEVMHTNAPEGVGDYCRRYSETMNRVLDDMKYETPPFQEGETLNSIEKAMGETVGPSPDDVKRLCTFRNEKLGELAGPLSEKFKKKED